MKKYVLSCCLGLCLCASVFAQQATTTAKEAISASKLEAPIPTKAERLAAIKAQLQTLSTQVTGLQEKVDVKLSQTSLTSFLVAVSQIHKVNINASEQLSNIRIINGFNDVTVSDLLLYIVDEYDLDLIFTGSILSLKPYEKPEEKPKEKEIAVTYNLVDNTLTLDLVGEPLYKVFRKIMDESAKNLLFAPEIKDQSLQLYLKAVSYTHLTLPTTSRV